MGISSNSKPSSAVKVLYNNEPVGYVLVEHIIFLPNDDDNNPKNNNEYEDWNKTISVLDSDFIKYELIDKGDIDYHTVNEMSFQIKKDEGFLIYEAKDNLGLVKMEMIPLSYITQIQIGRLREGLLLQQRHKLSKDEKRKGR